MTGEYDDMGDYFGKEEEVLTSKGPPKPIEELNDDSIRQAFARLPASDSKVRRCVPRIVRSKAAP